ncbi:uncharacterized protein C8orf76 homolog [Liolophura sinensis]|uniref:uncharacterized protein C8orf76 homolog n=1 Tax=Liolophura sinensis TaxID=3198878 RepID=UPI0031580867
MEFNFDDSIFLTEKRCASQEKLTSYNAKICSPLWFEDAESDSDESKITQLKFSADYHYMVGRYDKARQKYQAILESLPPGGMCMRRDVLESLSRCHLNVGNKAEAVRVARQLFEQGTNEDHEIQGLSLLHHIYTKTEDFTEDLPILQRLVTFHPQYHLYWLHMGAVYQGLVARGDLSPACEADHHVKTFTCYLRAKLLLKFSQRTSGSFVKSNQLNLSEEITEVIEKMDFTLDEKDRAEKVRVKKFEKCTSVNKIKDILEAIQHFLQWCIHS